MQRPAAALCKHARDLPPLFTRGPRQSRHVRGLCAHRGAVLQTSKEPTAQQQDASSIQQQQQQQQQLSSAEPQPLLDDWCQRSRLLVGADGLQKLAAVNVLLVGVGGVGSFAAEFLCRAGVGSMTLVDGDTVDTTNRNRQLPALRSTVGRLKTQVVAERLTDINPDLHLTLHQEFLDPERAAALVREQDYTYVIDCIDSVAPKVALLLAGHAAGVTTISSMGAGGRLNPSRVQLADISETHNDAFAAVVRKRLRKAGVTSGVTVVFSDESARPASLALTQQQYKRSYFGTSSYIPALFGLYIASHVIRQVVEPSAYQLPKADTRSSKAARKAGKGSKSSSSRGRGSSSSSSAAVSFGGRSTAVSVDSSSDGAGGSSDNDNRSSNCSSSSLDRQGSAALCDGVDASTASCSSEPGPSRNPGSDGISSSGTSKPLASASASWQFNDTLYTSFGRVHGVGMGYDGEGL